MTKPDLTTAQILGALLAAIYPVLTLIGVELSAEQQDALNNLIIIGTGLIGGDALIRFGRSRALAPAPQNITVLDPNAAQIGKGGPEFQTSGEVYSEPADESLGVPDDPDVQPPPAGR